MDLVIKLRELRRIRGLTQKDVGRLAGVGEKTVSSFETGARIGSMKISQLQRLLRVYGVTEAEFFGPALACQCDPLADQRPLEDAVVAAFDALPERSQAVVFARITYTFARPPQPIDTPKGDSMKATLRSLPPSTSTPAFKAGKDLKQLHY